MVLLVLLLLCVDPPPFPVDGTNSSFRVLVSQSESIVISVVTETMAFYV